MTGRPYDDLPAATRRRLILRTLLRPVLSFTGLLLLYYQLPLGESFTVSTTIWLFAGLLTVAALLTWQVNSIRNAEYPGMRAIEALAVTLPLFLLLFAAVYFATSSTAPATFSEELSRTDALYFAVTVFATVGFGDIVPVAQGARVVVMIQMMGDLILVGLVAHVIVGAVKSGLRRKEAET